MDIKSFVSMHKESIVKGLVIAGGICTGLTVAYILAKSNLDESESADMDEVEDLSEEDSSD